MKLFNMDSPLMQGLGKLADLMWLNVLTLICCLPIVTIGASLTAMNYMALKIVRNEECYITRGFFKSFKENFKQATIIWLIMLAVLLILAGDFWIMNNSTVEFGKVFRIVLTVVTIFVVLTLTYVFPVLSKFENTVFKTIKNAFFISLMQLPKTVLMIAMYALIPLILWNVVQLMPLALVFGLSLPAAGSAMLYNKFFKKLEDQILGAGESGEGQSASGAEDASEEEDERIFKDELDPALVNNDSNQ